MIAMLARMFHPEETSLLLNVAKVITPGGGYFALISLAQVKDVVSIVAGIIACICTVLVARSTIAANNRKNRE